MLVLPACLLLPALRPLTQRPASAAVQALPTAGPLTSWPLPSVWWLSDDDAVLYHAPGSPVVPIPVIEPVKQGLPAAHSHQVITVQG